MKKIIIVMLLPFILGGCAIQQALNMANLKYQMGDVVNITWAGINLSKVKSVNDLSVADAAKATAALLSKDYNLTFNVNVIAKNSTDKPAGLHGFDYQVLLDGRSMVDGSNPKININVSPNGGRQTIPIPVRINLKEVLKEQTLESVVNLAKQLTDYGSGHPSKVAVKFRPYIKVGDSSMKLSYITLDKTLK